VLLGKEEAVLQGMNEGLLEIGRRYRMEINVEKTRVMRISMQPSLIQIVIYITPKNLECLNYLCIKRTTSVRCTREIKSSIAMTKAAFNKKNTLFTSKLDSNFRKKLVKCYI
jgi:hypothetical protein